MPACVFLSMTVRESVYVSEYLYISFCEFVLLSIYPAIYCIRAVQYFKSPGCHEIHSGKGDGRAQIS